MELLLAKISIRKKLTIVIMLVSLLVLVLVAGIFISIEIYSSQNHLVMETKTLADSLGANLTQPLLLNDIPKSNNLLASLKRKPGVRAAYLFDAKGTPVASYLDQSDSQFLLKSIPEDFPDPSLLNGTDYNQERIVFSWSHMSLFLPLLHEGKRIGILYLLSDLKDLFGRVSGVVFGALLSMLFMPENCSDRYLARSYSWSPRWERFPGKRIIGFAQTRRPRMKSAIWLTVSTECSV